MTKDIKPFEEIRLLLVNLPPPCAQSVAAARARDARLTKPPGALGRLEELVLWLAAWQGKAEPTIEMPVVAVFAANHGVVAQGVSAFPAKVTKQMLDNFTAGGAAINQICKSFGVELKVFELALEHPTRDFTHGPAMDEPPPPRRWPMAWRRSSAASISWRRARWALATPPRRRRFTRRFMVARPPAGRDAARASTTPVSPARTRRSTRRWRYTGRS